MLFFPSCRGSCVILLSVQMSRISVVRSAGAETLGPGRGQFLEYFSSCNCVTTALFSFISLKDTQHHRPLHSHQRGDCKWTLSQFLEPKPQAAVASILMVRISHSSELAIPVP